VKNTSPQVATVYTGLVRTAPSSSCSAE